LDWISEIKNTPEHVFLVHGEEQARDTFRLKLKDVKHWNVRLPELFEIVEL
jgi:metallo-beta-lactamase family protein